MYLALLAPAVVAALLLADAATTVYLTKSGTKYHAEGCRYLAKSKVETTLGEARKKGRTACSVCKPPE